LYGGAGTAAQEELRGVLVVVETVIVPAGAGAFVHHSVELYIAPTVVWGVADRDVGGIDDAVHRGEIVLTGDGGGVDDTLSDFVKDGVEVTPSDDHTNGVPEPTRHATQLLVACRPT